MSKGKNDDAWIICPEYKTKLKKEFAEKYDIEEMVRGC